MKPSLLKSHAQVVGKPDELSVKATVRGAAPVVGEAVNAALGRTDPPPLPAVPLIPVFTGNSDAPPPFTPLPTILETIGVTTLNEHEIDPCAVEPIAVPFG